MNGFMLHIDARRCTVLRLQEGVTVWVKMWVKVRDGGPAKAGLPKQHRTGEIHSRQSSRLRVVSAQPGEFETNPFKPEGGAFSDKQSRPVD